MKKLLLRAGETILALALVLLFFVSFLAILGLSFPHGTSLGSLMLNRSTARLDSGRTNIDLGLPAATGSGAAPTAPAIVARLVQTRRRVKDKPAGAIVWVDSRSGVALQNRHSVQTLARSGATIAFEGENRAHLGENSLLVIQQPQRTAARRAHRSSVLLVEGNARGQLNRPGSPRMGLELVTATGATVLIDEEKGPVDFKVSVNPDRTSTIAAYVGFVEVSSAGETVTLEPGQWVTVAESEPPGIPGTLPGSPTPLSPRSGSVLAYRTAPPDVVFDWETVTDATGYRLTIGRDHEFDDVIHEERLTASEFTHSNLPEGRYYWRVAALVDYAEGLASDELHLDTRIDSEPPALEVAFPQQVVRAGSALLRGTTDPGTRIFIGEWSATADASGVFEHALELARGVNLIVVEAVDDAGNFAYRSDVVTASY